MVRLSQPAWTPPVILHTQMAPDYSGCAQLTCVGSSCTRALHAYVPGHCEDNGDNTTLTPMFSVVLC